MKIVQITDTHLTYRDGIIRENFDHIVELVNDHLRPDLVVHTGDIVILDPDSAADRERAHELMSRFTAPVRVVPGNHDVGEPGENPGMGIGVTDERVAAYEKVWGPGHWRLDLEGWTLLGLNSELLGSGLERESVQWQWLEETVAAVADERPVLVFLHKPIWSAVDVPTAHALDVGDAPRARLLDLLGRVTLKGVGSGHLHRYRRTDRDGVVEVWGPSTAFVAGPAGVHLPAALEQLGVVEYDCDAEGVRVAFRALPGLVDVTLAQVPEFADARAEIDARAGVPARVRTQRESA
ncbi:metallophosphoesterase family protein [Nocardia sp. NPDC058379]|uniref:metallophosphoesterase family protein n=1 Tax=unclassified Nocardia TaxID=2637762 RepID=UPI00364AE2E3